VSFPTYKIDTTFVYVRGICRPAIMSFSVLKQNLRGRIFKNDGLLGTNVPRWLTTEQTDFSQ